MLEGTQEAMEQAVVKSRKFRGRDMDQYRKQSGSNLNDGDSSLLTIISNITNLLLFPN